jgi:hypothetical protein
MIWYEALKRMGYFHIIATGAGAGLQQKLWEIPGCSWYLSGCTFPYDQDEQADLLGFMPEHFCSEDAAIDLASAAYVPHLVKDFKDTTALARERFFLRPFFAANGKRLETMPSKHMALMPGVWGYAQSVMYPIDGRFDVSSTELRNKVV